MKISFDPPKTPDRIDGIRVPYDVRKRFVAKWRWYLVLLLVLSPLLYFAISFVCTSLFVIAPGITRYKTYSLVAPVSGYVRLEPLKEGNIVAKGQLLGTIQNEEVMKRITLLESLAVEEEKYGRKSSAIAITAAKRAVAHQADYLARIKGLMEQGAATRAEYNEAEMRYEAALSQLAQLQPVAATGNFSLPPQKELEALRAISTIPLISPSEGILLYCPPTDGQFTLQGAPLLEFAQTHTLAFTAYLPPGHGRKAVIGRKVTIRFENDRKLSATVASIQPLTQKIPMGINRDFLEDNKLALPVLLHVQNPPENIPHNFPFTVNFGISLF